MIEYPLNTIYFYLTDSCNLRCRHCWIAPDYHSDNDGCQFLSLEIYRAIIRQAKPMGLSTVKLTGGEPLLHPDIMEIIDIARENRLRLNVETNGVLLSDSIAKRIASGGTPGISVSLDGATAETHEWVRGVEGCFDLAVQGIKNAVAAGLETQVIMTVMRRNVGEIEDLVRLAEQLGVGLVKFNVVQPTERGQAMHERGETLGVKDLIELGSSIENGLAAKTRVKLHFHHPPAFRPMGKMLDVGCTCGTCGITGIMGVLADGSYALCGIGEHIPEMNFGKAPTVSLKDVWEHEPILRQLREGLPDRLEGACADCAMKPMCMGSCIAQNYYRSKNLWAPFWYCEEAKKLGMFPVQRTISGLMK